MSASRARRAVAAALVSLLALSGCGTRAETETFSIAGGGTSGVYYSYGRYLAEALSSRLHDNFAVLSTAGSVENLRLVASGQSVVGFAQGDTAADAIRGEGVFTVPLDIRALARVYDEYVHVVVAADSDMQQVSDLAGRTISLGAEGSGVQVIASRVLSAENIDVEGIENPALGIDASIEALVAGEIEGFFWAGGFPTPGFARLAEEVPIRLLPIEAEVIERVNAGHAGVYRLSEFPVGAYGINDVSSTATMTVPNYLITATSTPESLANDVVRVLFEARTDISHLAPAAAYLDRRRAIFTYPIELHPGAARYYVDSRL